MFDVEHRMMDRPRAGPRVSPGCCTRSRDDGDADGTAKLDEVNAMIG